MNPVFFALVFFSLFPEVDSFKPQQQNILLENVKELGFGAKTFFFFVTLLNN